MRDKELYQRILGLAAPWVVRDVELDADKTTVRVVVDYDTSQPCQCPKCNADSPCYDKKPVRRWRHLDTCQYKTILECRIPRVRCKEHGTVQVRVPWAEPGSSFTALFEALVIDWLKEAPISSVAEQLRITWDQADGIMGRAVKRGLARREESMPSHLGIDEVAYQKHHEYVTVVLDKDNDAVIEILDHRKQEPLADFFKSKPFEHLEKIESVSMDMWRPFINAVKETVPDAENKICFDRFHVAQHFGNAVDKVRRSEHAALSQSEEGSILKGTKYEWLKNSDNVDNRTRRWFIDLTRLRLKTARAWAIKEAAADIWEYTSMTWALKAWKRLLGWMFRSRLKPIKKVAQMIKRHLKGIMNAIRLKQSNGQVEGKNTRIQKVKAMACGFRSRQRFKEAILFHLGKLDMYPETLAPLAHPKS